MSNKGKYTNYSPFLRVAGVTETIEESVDQSLRQDLYLKVNTKIFKWIIICSQLLKPTTQTPEKIKQYRKSFKEIPGSKQIHPGIYNDPKDYEDYIHGIKTAESDHVNQCIMGSNLSGINHFINNIYENKYAKNQREPLGKSIIRNYKLPDKIKEDDFRFGLQTTGCKFLKIFILFLY